MVRPGDGYLYHLERNFLIEQLYNYRKRKSPRFAFSGIFCEKFKNQERV